MIKRALPALLFCSLAGSALAATPAPARGDPSSEPQPHSACFTANEARMALHKVPALSVAVIRNGALDWSASWGSLQSPCRRRASLRPPLPAVL